MVARAQEGKVVGQGENEKYGLFSKKVTSTEATYFLLLHKRIS